MADSARTEIYGRIRRASRGAPAETIWRELQAIGAAPSAPLPSDDIGLAFLVNVLKNQGSIDAAGDRSAAVKAVANYLYQHFYYFVLILAFGHNIIYQVRKTSLKDSLNH